ncbi:MAG: hypothetical protein ACKO3R_05435 [bacterium]
MAIGGPNGNNLFNLNNLFKNAGVAPKNQPNEVSSTSEVETPSEAGSKLSGVAAHAARLRAQIEDGFAGRVDPNKEIIAGLKVATSTAIKFNENITATSALGEPSSVTAIKDSVFSEIAAGGNPEITFGNQQLLLAAKISQAGGITGDFQVSQESANLEENNKLLALVGNA